MSAMARAQPQGPRWRLPVFQLLKAGRRRQPKLDLFLLSVPIALHFGFLTSKLSFEIVCFHDLADALNKAERARRNTDFVQIANNMNGTLGDRVFGIERQ